MELLLPILVALVASGLTLFTGFGLGTLLLPALATVLPMEDAVAVTALVHLLNNLFKAVFVAKHARWELVFQFGIPAMLAAAAGAWTLVALGSFQPIGSWTLGSLEFGASPLVFVADPTPLEIVLGLLITIVAALALRTKAQQAATKPPLDEAVRMGTASGFLGGLSGHQGALRSAFLLKLGLPRDAFIGTNVVIGCMVDISRLTIYTTTGVALVWSRTEIWGPITLSAFLGAFLGVRLLGKTRMEGLRKLVGVTMMLLGLALAAGLIAEK